MDRRGLFKATCKFDTSDEDWVMPQTKEIIMGANDYRDMYVSQFIDSRIKNGISTAIEKISVRGNHKQAREFIREKYSSYKIFGYGSECAVIVMDNAIVEVYPSNNTIDFTISAEFKVIDSIKEYILETFEEIKVYINWIYNSHMERVSVPIDSSLSPVDEMYPFLNGESLDDYYKRYMESRSSILILIGPPGTGKTSFIRGMLQSTEQSAMVTYDQKVLATDSLFTEFMNDHSNVLVIEDADLVLSSRKEGNDMMSKFLNVGDGLVTVKGKKIIFSTNLPSIKDIDEALLRPGRCFDILQFDELDTAEAKKLVDKIGVDFNFDSTRHRYSVAEIYSGIKNAERKTPKSSFGFVPNK